MLSSCVAAELLQDQCYLWVRCFVRERSQRGRRGAGASAFLFQPLSGCTAAWSQPEQSRGMLPGPAAVQGRHSFSIQKRQGASGPTSASSAVG